MTIARIAVAGPFYEALDYLVPTEWLAQLPPVGSRVWVSVRNKDQVGLVVAYTDESHVPVAKLKWLLRRIDNGALVDAAHRRFIAWLADYYHAPLGDMYQLALPALLRNGTPAELLPIHYLHLTATGRQCTLEDFGSAPKQAFIWQQLQPEALPRSQLLALGASLSALKALMQKGWVESIQQTPTPPVSQIGVALAPNDAQASAIQQGCASLGCYHAIMLFGVTGSGKTEVYLQIIAMVIARDEQTLVLVPEIGLTPQTVARFTDRFGARVIALHSSLSDRERLDAWVMAQSGLAQVIIGTRSALLVPFKALGLIIVDEEHDSSFKQQDGIRYNARDAAVVRAYQLKIPVILGSATPSLETWSNVEKARYQLWSLPNRTLAAKPPSMHLIDLRSKPWANGLAEVLVDAMRLQLAAGNQVLLFLNRRGFSASLLCHQCGWSPMCQRCDSALTSHTEPLKLACHHCGYETAWRFRCHACHYTLAPVGTGTQRLSETLAQLFPDVPLLRIDRDSTRRKGSFDAMLATIHQGQAHILVGTQMLAKGHHFPHVTLVGILNADSGLYSADFRAPERLAQLIVQVAGRAGRETKPGTVYIQTLWPEHPLLQQLIQGGYETFLKAALRERERAALPPYRFVVLLGAEAKVEKKALAFLVELRDFLQLRGIKGLHLLGPVPALKEKRAGFYRAQLWLQSIDRRVLAQALTAVQTYLSQHSKAARTVRCFMDIDPYQMD